MSLLLSSFFQNTPAPYLEYGWVTAPNTAAQSITANTITTLTIDTEVQDAGGYGSISANQITLAAGTYYFEASTVAQGAGSMGITLAVYNVTSSSYITRGGPISAGGASVFLTVKSQVTFASTTTIDMRIFSSTNLTIQNTNGGGSNSTLSTAGADQRTTIRLWKLA